MWEWEVKTETRFNYRKIKLPFSYAHLGPAHTMDALLVGLGESVHPPARPQATFGKA